MSEKKKEYDRERYKKRREYVRSKVATYAETIKGRATSLLSGATFRAKWRGVKPENAIDFAWVMERLEAGKCELSGVEFDFETRSRRSPRCPSIDRINSELGYTKDNCRVIVWALNAGFGDWGADELKKIAKAWIAHEADNKLSLQPEPELPEGDADGLRRGHVPF